MIPRWRSRLVPPATALAVLVAAFLVWAQPARADSPCAEADALRSAGLLSEADAAYRRVLSSTKPDPCATKGLAELRAERDRRATLLSRSLRSAGVADDTVDSMAALVRDGREDEIPDNFAANLRGGDGFAIARALKVAGYLQAAGSVLAATIATDPSAELPEDLQGLSDAGIHLAAAEALSRAGLDSASQEELELALKEDPTLPVPDELASPTRREWWWNSFLGAVGPLLLSAAEIVIAVLAAVVLILLGVRLIRRFRIRMVVEAFTGGPDEKSGTAAVAMVRENYGRLREQSGGRSLELLTSSGEESLQLPGEVSSAYPQAGVIWALVRLLDRLFPSRKRLVTGYLRPRDPVRGAGMTITYGRRYGKVFGEITLWESDYGSLAPSGEEDPKQRAYDRIAVPAATWIVYQAGERFLRRRLGLTAPFELIGTREWRSYAHFAVGADDHARDDWQSARRRYLEALRHDPGNRGARFDLAVVELDPRFEGNGRQAALGRLEGLRAELEGAGNAARDPLWYRVRYMQAVAQITTDAVVAHAAAVDLCARLVSRLDQIEGQRRRTAADERERAFLFGVQPMALVLLASALKQEGYNGAAAGPIDRSELAEALRQNDFDHKVTHDAIVGYVTSEFEPLDAGANYNLACYYARVGQAKDDEVTARLRAAVELGGPPVGEEALRDPVLKDYFERRGHRAAFDKLFSGLRDPKPESEATAAHESLLQKIFGEFG
jgi:tetratricopeptide (TPR) repeat protein